MDDAPEKIWAARNRTSGETMWWPDDAGGVGAAYIREDVALAMVAAHGERCGQIAKDEEAEHTLPENEYEQAQKNIAGWIGNRIRSLTPDDAKAALDRLIAEAVRKEREACAKVAETSHERWRDELTAHEVECDVIACQDIATAIRNRSEKDG